MADDTSKPEAAASPDGDPAQPAQPAQGATPPTPGEALASARQVEELADHLSTCADAIHARVMRDIGRYPGEVPESEKSAARALLDDEQVLRQRADRLYQDAAACIVSSLGRSQQHVIQLTADAAARIQTIVRLGDAVSLAARLVNVAGAAMLGQGLALVTALDALQGQLALIGLHNPPPAPAPGSAAPSEPASA